MTCARNRIAALVLAAGLPASADAQVGFLIADRANNALWMIDDRDGDGTIQEPGEVWRWFDASNAAGTPSIANPNCLAVRTDGLVAVGDQEVRAVFLFRDLNRDGDALDPGESWLAVGEGNASGISLAFPTGLAFGADGALYVTNAGNAFGADAVYRLVDLNGDGDFQDEGEIEPCLSTGAFGAIPNGPYAPQEIVLTGTAAATAGFLRNSSASLHGVYRFLDLDGNGRADDPGEFAPFWDLSGASGVTPSAGFPLELDAARPGALYTHQIATGGIDQIVRLMDLNGDGDAQDPGEALIAYSTGETGFTLIDLVSLPDGRVLLTDNSGKKVYRLTDLDQDGTFNGPGERDIYFANTAGMVGDLRPMAVIGRACPANCDLSTTPPVLNVNDFVCFQAQFAAGDLAANCDSSTTPPLLNVNDFVCFQSRFAAGCP